MRAKDPDGAGGFTLLELVIVLAILAALTAVATREIGYVQDQQRFETSQRGLDVLRDAVLGSPDDRLPDGTRTAAGFVADMGRLPRTVASSAGLSLAELWASPGAPFDVRPALSAHGVPAAEEDPQVLVSGGWRGPYLRLPPGLDTWQDGWGNAMTSPAEPAPADPDAVGYARLRDADDAPLTAPGQDIRIVRHLGANGRRNAADAGYDRDVELVFGDDLLLTSVKGQVDVRSGNAPAEPDTADTVTVRLFGPDPADPARIRTWRATVPFAANPVLWEIPASAGLTPGPRVVRAYFADANGSGTTVFRKSAVTRVVLRAGANPLDLVIDR